MIAWLTYFLTDITDIINSIANLSKIQIQFRTEKIVRLIIRIKITIIFNEVFSKNNTGEKSQ